LVTCGDFHSLHRLQKEFFCSERKNVDKYSIVAVK